MGWELPVGDRGDDPGDPARGRRGLNCGGHLSYSLPASAAANAFAPPTISLISCVISACLAAFASLVSVRMNSFALSGAAFIARRRDACSAAAACSRAL